nr:glycosyltransferase 87 family protein [Corynebacterium aquatimens]
MTGQTTILCILSVLVGLFGYQYWVTDDYIKTVFDPWPFEGGMPLDLWIYMRGGERVLDGVPLYDGGIFGRLPFTYTPFAAAIFALVSTLNDATITLLWHTTTVLGTVLVVALCVVAYAPTQRKTVDATTQGERRGAGVFRRQASTALLVLLLAAFFLLGTEPLQGSLYWGQINVILMALVFLDFLPRKSALPGIGVGLAAGIKLTPAIFGILFLLQRRWWAAAGSFITFLVTVGIGYLLVPDAQQFWTHAIFSSDRVGKHNNPGAQSIRSLMERTLGTDSTVLWLVLALVFFGFILWVAWQALRVDDVPAAVGLIGIGACMISPFSWYHHWVWIVPFGVALLFAVNRLLTTLTPRGDALLDQVIGALSMAALALYCLPLVSVTVNVAAQDPYRPGTGPWELGYMATAVIAPAIYVAAIYVSRPRRSIATESLSGPPATNRPDSKSFGTS